MYTSSTLDMGMYNSNRYSRITRTTNAINTANAAFSISVIWISIGRNSTRQPKLESGGGLKRTVCQFVD